MEVKTIDYVVPMVFHDDLLWQADFKMVNHLYDEGNRFEFVRFRSWNTERLLIKCVKRFMPFVRNIYVLLARESQKQEWMDEEGVNVVYHRDFIPDRFLPTFNSCAIEMFLYRIPGISERFVYGNDDMFPVSELKEEDFFCGEIPCQHYAIKDMPAAPNIFHLSCRSGMNFVGREFDKTYLNSWLHGGHGLTPMVKSTWEYLWKIGKDRIEASITPFRSEVNFNQWICPWWHHLSGNYIDQQPISTYVGVGRTVDEVKNALLNSNGVVCVNDNECENDYMKYGRAVIETLEQKLKS